MLIQRLGYSNEKLDYTELQKLVYQSLELLTLVEQNVIKLRYLFDGNKQPSQQSVSVELSLGHQSAVSAIERASLSKIWKYISDHQTGNSSASVPESAPAPESAFFYQHSPEDCQIALSYWGDGKNTVHHTIRDIWRFMAPYTIGKVMQILIQAGCITPQYAVRTLKFGDKKE